MVRRLERGRDDSVLSDNGGGYISRSFREYLKLVGIRHILAAPSQPQTNAKLKGYGYHPSTS